MRPGQQNKRGRGRNNNNNNNNNRKGGNPLSRTYDSSGPDVKIRGTAQHIAEKYATLARDAQSSGDNVMAENYLQHAEHYNRIIAAAQAQMQERYQRDERESTDRDGERDDRDEGERAGGDRPEAQRGNGHDRGGNNGQERAARNQDEVRNQDDEGADREEQRQAQAHINGSGPQPVIEGMPAEVAIEEEMPASGARRPAQRRRTAASRPRRPRKADSDSSETGEASGKPAAKGEDDKGESPMAGATSE